jgi:hypothetical protein
MQKELSLVTETKPKEYQFFFRPFKKDVPCGPLHSSFIRLNSYGEFLKTLDKWNNEKPNFKGIQWRYSQEPLDMENRKYCVEGNAIVHSTKSRIPLTFIEAKNMLTRRITEAIIYKESEIKALQKSLGDTKALTEDSLGKIHA